MYTLLKNTIAGYWEWLGSRGDPQEGEEVWSRNDIETCVERVNRGAQLLDEEKPGWQNEVIPDKLDMRSSSFCIIGQVYGDYDEYVGVPFGLGEDMNDEAADDAIEHGFLTRRFDEDKDIPWALLDLVWVTLLQERAEANEPVLLELPSPQPRNVLFQALREEALIDEYGNPT